jgi:hypothetical protein
MRFATYSPLGQDPPQLQLNTRAQGNCASSKRSSQCHSSQSDFMSQFVAQICIGAVAVLIASSLN